MQSLAIFLSFLIIFILSGISFLIYVFLSQSTTTILDDDAAKKGDQNKKTAANKKIAVVKCSPFRSIDDLKLSHYDKTDCNIYLSEYGKNEFCQYGCIGYGTCAKICPESAIIIKNNTAVITEACTGCGICVSHCPQKLISLVPINSETYKQCNLPKYTKNEKCSASCISCEKCEISGFTPEYCPHMCQKKAPANLNKSFKFWKFCCNILNK